MVGAAGCTLTAGAAGRSPGQGRGCARASPSWLGLAPSRGSGRASCFETTVCGFKTTGMWHRTTTTRKKMPVKRNDDHSIFPPFSYGSPPPTSLSPASDAAAIPPSSLLTRSRSSTAYSVCNTVRFRHHMPSCDHQRSRCRPLSPINCLPPPPPATAATAAAAGPPQPPPPPRWSNSPSYIGEESAMICW